MSAHPRPCGRPRGFRNRLAGLLTAATLFSPAIAYAQAAKLTPDTTAFRALYQELVEMNTVLGVGSCTDAAARMATRLRAAGYPDADLTLFSTPEHPKEGGLVARLPGTDPSAKPILLLAHLDVVAAKREDWTRDPFKLVEEGGYFYGRGTSDDKAMAAVFVDSLIRFRQTGYRPKRTIKLALTCGEESGDFNGAQWLVANRRPLIDAAFALNEGAGGQLDAQGRRVLMEVQSGEKVYQDFTLEATGPGGHSSQPYKPNVIAVLARALARVDDFDFPVRLNDTTRAYFTQVAALKTGATAAAMRAIVADPNDRAADAELAKDKMLHSLLRTTCVTTLLEGGHAPNALPQRAKANVNCRIFPGQPVEEVRAALARVAADPAVKVTTVGEISRTVAAPPLTREIMGPIESVSAALYPGVPIVPVMSTGATDGKYLTEAGIPTYGVEGMFYDPDLGNIHGLNERVRVQSLYDGRAFLYRLVKLYAGD